MMKTFFTQLRAPLGQRQCLFWSLLYNPASGLEPGAQSLLVWWVLYYINVDMDSGWRQFYVALLVMTLCKAEHHFRTSLGRQGYTHPIHFLELRNTLVWRFNAVIRHPPPKWWKIQTCQGKTSCLQRGEGKSHPGATGRKVHGNKGNWMKSA